MDGLCGEEEEEEGLGASAQDSTWNGLGRAQKVHAITLRFCFYTTREHVCVVV